MILDKPIDPYYQQKYFYAVFDNRGKVIGTVYVLDSSHKPRREKGASVDEAYGH